MMFNRNKFLMTLLAVVLLGSLIGGGVELVKKSDWSKRDAEASLRHRRKPRTKAIAVMPVFDPTAYQASLHSLVNQVAGWMLGTDPDTLQATAAAPKSRHPRHRTRTAWDASVLYELAGGARTPDPCGITRCGIPPSQVAGGAKAIDPSGRLTYEPSSGIELAGGAKIIDPDGRLG